MNDLCQFECQNFFRFVDFCAFQSTQTTNFIHRQECQQCQTFFNVLIANVSPVLVEFIRCCFFRIQPYSAGYCFTHFYTFRVCQQFECHAVSGFLGFTTDQFYTGDDVGPLVVAAHLQGAVVSLVQFVEVITLHDHVVEFQEGQTSFFFHSCFEAVCSQHSVYGEVYADITQEFNVVQVSQPVTVVYDDGTAFTFVEIDETGQLVFDTSHVVVDSFYCHHFTHVSFTGRVTDHCCTAAYQTDRSVAASLHVCHCHYCQEMTNVQGICCGVDTDIECYAAFFKKGFDFFFMGQLFDKAAFFQYFISIHDSFSFAFCSLVPSK